MKLIIPQGYCVLGCGELIPTPMNRLIIINRIHSKGLNSILSLNYYELTKNKNDRKISKETRIYCHNGCRSNNQILKDDGFKLPIGDGTYGTS